MVTALPLLELLPSSQQSNKDPEMQAFSIYFRRKKIVSFYNISSEKILLSNLTPHDKYQFFQQTKNLNLVVLQKG